jgi:hypothetical protein
MPVAQDLKQSIKPMMKRTLHDFRWLLLTCFILCGAFIAHAQTTITIGTGTVTANRPLNYYNTFGRSAILYTATDMGTTTSGGMVTSVAFECNTALNTGVTKIYMRNAGSATAETAMTWANKIAGAQTVYEGTPGNTSGWRTITLTTPFLLLTGQNLEVMVETSNGQTTVNGASGGNQIRYTTATSSIQYWTSTSATEPAGNGLVSSTRPNIQITLNPATGCIIPVAAAITNITNTAATFNWSSSNMGSVSQGYEYELRTSGTGGSGAAGLIASGSTPGTTTGFTGLVPGTAYTAYVRSFCGGVDYSTWVSASFTAPTYIPVGLSGLTADVIANGVGAASASSNAAVDDISVSAGYALVSKDFRATPTGPAPAAYLPESGSIADGLKYYKLGNYSGNNALRLVGPSQTGTLTFLAPKKATTVYVLGVSGSAASTADITVNFTDNVNPAVFTAQSYPDWYNPGNYVLQAVGRVNRSNNGLEAAANGPNLYEVELPLSVADQSRQISSITIATTSGSAAGAKLNVLGVSILPSAVQNCALPSSLTAGNVQATAAAISWQSNGTSTNYQLSYGDQGIQAAAGTIVDVPGATSYPLSSLAPVTPYQVFVRAICGPNVGDTSEWVGPVNFTTTLLPCTGQPAAGTLSGPATVYNGANFTITIAGNTAVNTAAGLSMQWQKSATGAAGSWTNIPGTTASTLVTSQTGVAYYRAYTTCSFTGLADTTAAISVLSYCVPSYPSGCANNRITAVTLGTINNTMTNCSITDFTSMSATLNAGATYPMSVITTGFVAAGVAADFNNDGDFTDAGEILALTPYIATSTATYNFDIMVPASVPAGTYRMRVYNRGANSGAGTPADSPCGAYGYGTFNDYTINVLAAVYCAGTPAPGNTIAGASSFCVSGSTVLSLQNNYLMEAGITYQWQSYDAGTSSWVNIAANANSATYTTPVLTASTDYRCAVTCSSGNVTGYSNPVALAVHPLPAVTVTPSLAAFCGTSINITANGADTYVWSPATDLNTTTGNVVTASPPASATYLVTGTDINGCSNTASTTVAPVTSLQVQAAALYSSNCTGPNTPVTIEVTPIGTGSGTMEYVVTDSLGTTLTPWQASTTFTVTPTANGSHLYKVYARNTDCPFSSTLNPAEVRIYVGFTANVTATNATCANDDGSISVNDVQGPGNSGMQVLYANNFSSTSLNASEATLHGVASITSGRCQLTPNTNSQKGGLTVLNPAVLNGDLANVSFLLTVTPAGADGVSYSFGDDANYASSPAELERGAGTKLKVCFVSYGGNAGIYITYGAVTTNPVAGGPNVLASSNNTTWANATNKPVSIDVNEQGKLSLTLDGALIFSDIQLPPAYLAANKSAWKHLIGARTGGVSELHAIDNLSISYYTQYNYGVSPGGSGTLPPTWQGSKNFNNLPGNTSYDVWIANSSNPAACNKFLGTYNITAPVTASLPVSAPVVHPTLCGSTDGSITIAVNNPGTYDIQYTKDALTPTVITGVTATTVGTENHLLISGLSDGVYTGIKAIQGGCNSNALGPVVLAEPLANAIAGTSYTTAPAPQAANVAYTYTNNACQLLAKVSSTANLGNVTAQVTLGAAAGSFNNEPYVGRYYEIHPTQNANQPAQLTLYFSQADFDAYNLAAAALPNSSVFPPINGTASNLLITVFHGQAASGTTGPNGQYNNNNKEVLTPTSVIWNANGTGWWEVTFTTTGFSGFFAHYEYNRKSA